tara:strand:+ start:1718 stop:1927 length:210 start_codon:yes stop_codon:yes gene_type:complete
LAREDKLYHFAYKKKVHLLTDLQLKEEKSEADYYVRLCRKVRQSLTHGERNRIKSINREIKKRLGYKEK